MTERLVERMRGFGTTIFAEMSALAAARPAASTSARASPTPTARRSCSRRRSTRSAPGTTSTRPAPGIPELRHAIGEHQQRHYGLTYDPDTEVLVTAGATEAIAAASLALAGPGDEVVIFEPYYDSYAACIALAGAQRRTVTLRPRCDGWAFDPAALDAAITPGHKVILLNTPHNPTGKVFGAGRAARRRRRRDPARPDR